MVILTTNGLELTGHKGNEASDECLGRIHIDGDNQIQLPFTQ